MVEHYKPGRLHGTRENSRGGYDIVNVRTWKVVGWSPDKRSAQASARIRDQAIIRKKASDRWQPDHTASRRCASRECVYPA